jgi:thioredoxin 1
MGFLQRILGIERRPGEPDPTGDDRLDDDIAGDGRPAFVFFYSLWCPQCQVMHGLINELGPRHAGRARFLRMDVSKNPRSPGRFDIRGVPQLIVFKDGRPVDRVVGLMPIDSLEDWIEGHIGGAEGGAGDKEQS